MGELGAESQVAARWPTVYDWSRGESVDGPRLGRELQDALRFLGFAFVPEAEAARLREALELTKPLVDAWDPDAPRGVRVDQVREAQFAIRSALSVPGTPEGGERYD